MRYGLWLAALFWIAWASHEPMNGRVVSPPRTMASGCSIPGDAAALRQITETWKDGYNSGNAAGVAALYTPDAMYLTQHFAGGIVDGRQAIQAYVQRGVDAKYHVDDIAILRMECSGDMAYVIDRYTSTNGGQRAMGVNLVVLRRIEGMWRIAAHEAAVPDPATAVQKLDAPEK